MNSIKMEMEWVDVNERPPEKENTYLVLYEDMTFAARYFEPKEGWRSSRVINWLDVKLPEPEIEIGKIYEYNDLRFRVVLKGLYGFCVTVENQEVGDLTEQKLSLKNAHELIDKKICYLKNQCKIFGIELANDDYEERSVLKFAEWFWSSTVCDKVLLKIILKRKRRSDMRHECESNIKCPYCDWEDEDSWEFGEDSGTYTCGDCGKEFNVKREVEVTYSTSRLDCLENKTEHDYKVDSFYMLKRKHENGIFIDLPENEWTYHKIMMCSICGDKDYIKLTKDEYLNFKKEQQNGT
jgi:hypothetical protein